MVEVELLHSPTLSIKAKPAPRLVRREYVQAEDTADKKMPVPPSIYFGGCCFASCYYIGVCEAMREYWGEDFHSSTFISGDSAGSLVAVSFALGQGYQAMHELYTGITDHIALTGERPFLDNQSDCLKEGMVRLLDKYPKAFKSLQGRLAIGTTEMFGKHRWIIQWEDNFDLLNSIGGSSHIPLFCSRHRGVTNGSNSSTSTSMTKKPLLEVVDGAYGLDGPDFFHGNNTLYIGFDPLSEVCGKATHIDMIYPRRSEHYERLVQQGYDDFYDWIENGAKYKTKKELRKPNYKVLVLLHIMKLLELFIAFVRQIIESITKHSMVPR